MQARAGTFADRIKSLYGAFAVQVYLYATTHIVGTWAHWNILLDYVYAQAKALCVYVRKVLSGFVSIFVRYIEADVGKSVYLHFVVDSPCHYIAGSERKSLIVFLHKLVAIGQTKNTAIAAHRFGYQESRTGFFRIVKHRRVELHELHIGNGSFRSIHHCHTVASGYARVRRCAIDSSATASCHKRNLA